ncbi:MAG: hypothetical protein HY260_06920 [Chloroflexi bacterium]|nr:hypothetical protein [Chloroflexota bacterium]
MPSTRLLSSHYETVARAFQVLDIAAPLRAFQPPDAQLGEVWEELTAEDPVGFCLIRDSERIYGFFAFDDDVFLAPLEGIASDKLTQITPDQIVSGSMSLLDLISLFRRHYFFFVLTRNDLTHVVSFQDLDNLPVKLCLFSLLMALEAEIVDLLAASGSIEQHLSLLPEGRLNKAKQLCGDKYGADRITADKILLCTTFIDKKTMLLRSPALSSRLPFQSKNAAERFFKRTESLRNQIAHSDSIFTVLNSPDEFDGFVSELRQVSEALSGLQDT